MRLYGPTDFTNPINPFDVNASGNVTALDALLVINQLNRGADGSLPPVTPGEVPSSADSPLRAMSFFDVTADAYITSLDALRVINEINRQEDESTGESIMESIEEKKILFGDSKTKTDRHQSDDLDDENRSIHLSRSNDIAHGLVDATVTSASNQAEHSTLVVRANSAVLESSLIDLALLQEWSDPFESEWL